MRIAVCEAGPLTPEQDAGSRAVVDLIGGYRALGHEVGVFIEAEQRLPQRVRSFGPDVIVVSRPGLFVRLEPLLRPLAVPMVYFAHDLHFVRVGFEQALGGRPAAAADILRLVERQCFTTADLAVLPTPEEVAIVEREFPSARAVAINYFAMPEQPDRRTAPTDDLVVFAGGAHHAPNRDGVHWFVRQVWAEHLRRRPDARLVVCGLWGAVDRIAAPGVEYTGVIPEAELDGLLGRARVGIAPLRFGAGMKRKTLHYLSHGLPVVGTSFSIEGLADDAEGAVPGVLAAETATQFGEALDLLADDELWLASSQAGAAFVRRRFSSERHLAGLESVLDALR